MQCSTHTHTHTHTHHTLIKFTLKNKEKYYILKIILNFNIIHDNIQLYG